MNTSKGKERTLERVFGKKRRAGTNSCKIWGVQVKEEANRAFRHKGKQEIEESIANDPRGRYRSKLFCSSGATKEKGSGSLVWQDGTKLASGYAFLLKGVTKIQAVQRGGFRNVFEFVLGISGEKAVRGCNKKAN